MGGGSCSRLCARERRIRKSLCAHVGVRARMSDEHQKKKKKLHNGVLFSNPGYMFACIAFLGFGVRRRTDVEGFFGGNFFRRHSERVRFCSGLCGQCSAVTGAGQKLPLHWELHQVFS